MANYCTNFITITGSEENMKPIYEFFKDSYALEHNDPRGEVEVMSHFIPYENDDEYKRIVEESDFILNPFCTFYGTKWDFQLCDCNTDDNLLPTSVTFSPSTAWSPPIPFCQKLSEKYGVNVHIEYYEGGNDFSGQSEFSDGEEIVCDEYTYDEGMYIMDNEGFWYEVESDLEMETPEDSLEVWLSNLYSFVTDEDDINELKRLYNEALD